MGAEVYLIHTSVESQGSKAEEERRSDEEEERRCPADSGWCAFGCCGVPDGVLGPPRLGPFSPLPLPVIHTLSITRPRIGLRPYDPVFVILIFPGPALGAGS